MKSTCELIATLGNMIKNGDMPILHLSMAAHFKELIRYTTMQKVKLKPYAVSDISK
jgi:hypothetical protein